MKFKLWKEYGALNSTPVFDAFAQGLNNYGFTIVDDHNIADVNVIWSVLWHGRMAKNQKVWDYNKPTIVLEVGGIKRGTTWKAGLNGINRDGNLGPSGNNNNRARSLGLELKPWRKTGDYILICGQHDKSLQWANMPPMSKWIMHTIETIQLYSDKPILFRPHPRCPLLDIESQYKNVYRQQPKKLLNTYDDFDMSFNNIWATVNWSSNPGIHSVINGVPIFTGPSSLAWPVSNTGTETIENPTMPDRQQWLNDYAHTEYTVDEIKQGVPLTYLTSLL